MTVQVGSTVHQVAREIAIAHARIHRPSYFSEPFEPHEWCIQAIADALQHASDYDRVIVNAVMNHLEDNK